MGHIETSSIVYLNFPIFLISLQYVYVLQGRFEVTICGKKEPLELKWPKDTAIEKGDFYEITNKSEKTGVIEFVYLEDDEVFLAS